MTIAWSGNGGLFTILGAYACWMRTINGARGATAPDPSSAWGSGGPQIRALDTAVANIVAAHSAAQEKYYDGIVDSRNGYVSAQTQTLEAIKAQVNATFISIVNADNPQPDATLATAMREMIRQFTGASQTVKRCVVAATVTAGGSNIGNATIICSVTGRFGVPQEYAIAETVVATCVGDSVGNGSTGTAGAEPIQITAPAVGDNKLAQDWPDGSGASVSINVVDPNEDAGANLLTNSNFEIFTTPNIPDNFTILVGSAGTSIKKDTGVSYGNNSAFSLSFTGDGAELTSIVQPFGASAGSGTTADLTPATVYAFNIWVYAPLTIAAGVLAIDLVNSSNVVINDDAGTANTISKTLSTLVGATWTNVSGFFRTPTNMPTTVKLRIRLSTAMTNTRVLNMDFAAMAVATQLYTAGPYVCAFRASTDIIYNDRWTIAVTNDRAGIFQTFFEQMFDMTSLRMILPSVTGGGETVSDSLVA